MMKTYLKLNLTPEQIMKIDANRINTGPLIEESAPFSAKPIPVELLDNDGNSLGTGHFIYGVTQEVFVLDEVTNLPINNRRPKPLQQVSNRIRGNYRRDGIYKNIPWNEIVNPYRLK